jgi:hypothetical protein
MLPIRMKQLFTNKTFVLLLDKFTQEKGVVCMFTQCDGYIPTMIPFVAKSTRPYIYCNIISRWAHNWVQIGLGYIDIPSPFCISTNWHTIDLCSRSKPKISFHTSLIMESNFQESSSTSWYKFSWEITIFFLSSNSVHEISKLVSTSWSFLQHHPSLRVILLSGRHSRNSIKSPCILYQPKITKEINKLYMNWSKEK